jgi:hypothetical protein
MSVLPTLYGLLSVYDKKRPRMFSDEACKYSACNDEKYEAVTPRHHQRVSRISCFNFFLLPLMKNIAPSTLHPGKPSSLDVGQRLRSALEQSLLGHVGLIVGADADADQVKSTRAPTSPALPERVKC